MRETGKEEGRMTVMTVEEVAKYLKIPKNTIKYLARLRRLPAQKVGKRWRFIKETIDDYLRNGKNSV